MRSLSGSDSRGGKVTPYYFVKTAPRECPPCKARYVDLFEWQSTTPLRVAAHEAAVYLVCSVLRRLLYPLFAACATSLAQSKVIGAL